MTRSRVKYLELDYSFKASTYKYDYILNLNLTQRIVSQLELSGHFIFTLLASNIPPVIFLFSFSATSRSFVVLKIFTSYNEKISNGH